MTEKISSVLNNSMYHFKRGYCTNFSIVLNSDEVGSILGVKTYQLNNYIDYLLTDNYELSSDFREIYVEGFREYYITLYGCIAYLSQTNWVDNPELFIRICEYVYGYSLYTSTISADDSLRIMDPGEYARESFNRYVKEHPHVVSDDIKYDYGYVYIVTDHKGNVKIGKTKNPASRLLGLQTSNPFKLDFAKVYNISNMSSIESQCHKEMSDYLVRGEWYRISLKKAIKIVGGIIQRNIVGGKINLLENN